LPNAILIDEFAHEPSGKYKYETDS
jgi:hypothetical protein